MATIPLAMRLKRRLHKTVALAQDLVVMELYNTFPGAVLHGGTAIWRCYRGNRFSEDVDFYLSPAWKARIESFIGNLRTRGLIRQKFKETKSALFGKFSYSGAVVSFEASLRLMKNYTVRPFEMVDGSFMMANTLQPEELVLEKISAYVSRRKVRDLYDIFFLVQLLKRSDRVEKSLGELIRDFRRPVDERGLRALITTGSVPSVENMLEVIEQWAR